MICPNCGFESETNICLICGAEIPAIEDKGEEPETASNSGEHKNEASENASDSTQKCSHKARNVLISVLALITAAAVFFGVFSIVRNSDFGSGIYGINETVSADSLKFRITECTADSVKFDSDDAYYSKEEGKYFYQYEDYYYSLYGSRLIIIYNLKMTVENTGSSNQSFTFNNLTAASSLCNEIYISGISDKPTSDNIFTTDYQQSEISISPGTELTYYIGYCVYYNQSSLAQNENLYTFFQVKISDDSYPVKFKASVNPAELYSQNMQPTDYDITLYNDDSNSNVYYEEVKTLTNENSVEIENGVISLDHIEEITDRESGITSCKIYLTLENTSSQTVKYNINSFAIIDSSDSYKQYIKQLSDIDLNFEGYISVDGNSSQTFALFFELDEHTDKLSGSADILTIVDAEISYSSFDIYFTVD